MSRFTLKLRWLTLRLAYKRWRLGHNTMARQLLRTTFGVKRTGRKRP